MRKRSIGWAIGATLVALTLAAAPARAADTDLALTSSYLPSPATAGQDTTLTLVTTNNGGPATNVTLQIALPAVLAYKSNDSGCTLSSGTVTCLLGSLAAAASKTVKVTLTPSSAGTASAGSVVSSTENDTHPADNTSSPTLTINPAPKANPTIGASVSGTPQAFQPQTMTATLTGGSSPSGKIDFQVFAPADATCAGSPLLASIVDVNAAKQATSDPFTTGTGGTYHWTATYLGDGANETPSRPPAAPTTKPSRRCRRSTWQSASPAPRP